jgi:hypothetical protein
MEARAFGSGRRSRWDPEALDAMGALTFASAGVALVLVILARATGSDLDWQPYPSLTMPSVSPLMLAACLVLAVPWLPWPRRTAPVPSHADG